MTIPAHIIEEILGELSQLHDAEGNPDSAWHPQETHRIAAFQSGIRAAARTVLLHAQRALHSDATIIAYTPRRASGSTAQAAEQPTLWDAPTSPTEEEPTYSAS